MKLVEVVVTSRVEGYVYFTVTYKSIFGKVTTRKAYKKENYVARFLDDDTWVEHYSSIDAILESGISPFVV